MRRMEEKKKVYSYEPRKNIANSDSEYGRHRSDFLVGEELSKINYFGQALDRVITIVWYVPGFWGCGVSV